MTRLNRRPSMKGFTLVELIMVMVISGLISGAIVMLVRQPIRAFVDTAQRAEIADVSDDALRLMARELRTAVPNSIRISGDGTALEFIPALIGGRYFAPADVPPAGTQLALSFTNSAATTFTADFLDPSPQRIVPGKYVIVYNLGTGFSWLDAYQTGNDNGNRAEIVQVNGSNITIGDPQAAGAPLNFNVFSRAAPMENGSPTQRFHVADPPIIYRCQPIIAGGNGQLRRITGQGFNAVQAIPTAPNLGQLLAADVQTCSFSSITSAQRIGALVSLQLTIRRPGANQPTATLFRQLQIDNTP